MSRMHQRWALANLFYTRPSCSNAPSIWASVRSPTDAEASPIELSVPREPKYSSLKSEFISVLTSGHNSQDRNTEFDFYLKLLESYSARLTPLLRLPEAEARNDPIEQMQFKEDFLNLLIELAKSLAASDTPTLESLRESLTTQSAFLDLAINTDAAYTILFSMVGWLSMVYQPSIVTTYEEKPALVLESADYKGAVFQTGVYFKKRVVIEDNSSISLRYMLLQYGDLVPRPCIRPPNDHSRGDVFQEQLVVSYLNFYTLHSIAGIRPVLVDCISLHLDFDEKTRKLRIFRFPSFCKLMCRCSTSRDIQTEKSLAASISRLFISDPVDSRTRAMTDYTALDIYREVLLSYRILFGQDKRSRTAAKRHMQYRGDASSRIIIDPLLQSLCEKDGGKESTYEDIEAMEIAQQYSVHQDFPFFGERMIKIQQFVLKKNPSDWRTLWNDRRDLLRFNTFWAVVIFGVISLVFSFLQLVEGAIQVAYAVHS